MNAPGYWVVVFGKKDCDKCGVLNSRLDRILAEADYADFEKRYCDVQTQDGLVALAEAETLAPQRIPSFQVRRLDPETGEYARIPEDFPEGRDTASGELRVPTFVGVETDYAGNGVITPQAIREALDQARSAPRR